MPDFLEPFLGPDSDQITWWQMGIRGVIVFIIALALVRFGDRRIFGKNTAFDIVLGIIFGSILSRAITGNSPFLPTIFTALVLVCLHRLFAFWAFRQSMIGPIIKGSEKQIVEDGKMDFESMKSSNITKNDLLEACRQSGVAEIEQVKEAYIERGGGISIIKKEGNNKKKEPTHHLLQGKIAGNEDGE